jgi:hypothetical protein
MSYHIKLKEYNCPSCNALYIPYKVNMLCPFCRKIPENTPKEYLGFIDEVIISLKMNKVQGGRYLPNAWYIGSTSEYFQDVIFRIFDALDKNKTDTAEVFIDGYLNLTERYKDAIYMKNYIKSMFLEVYSRKSELHISIWNKFLLKLLP